MLSVSIFFLSKGTYPTKGMTKTLTACVSNYESCCEKSYEVEVKNCGGFNVYRLPTTFGCSQAYCFGIILTGLLFLYFKNNMQGKRFKELTCFKSLSLLINLSQYLDFILSSYEF